MSEITEITGKLIVKNETQSFGSNNFRKREVVIETEDSKYPQTIMIEFIQDKCDLMDKFNVGDTVKIAYNLNGRSWVNPEGETRYFNAVQGWRIDKVDSQSLAPAQPQPLGDSDEVDDLPF